jgi:hypothetical protein
MTVPPTAFASSIQNMAKETKNEKLAFLLTGLSVILIAKMVYDEFNKVTQHRLREFDRHHGRESDIPDRLRRSL